MSLNEIFWSREFVENSTTIDGLEAKKYMSSMFSILYSQPNRKQFEENLQGNLIFPLKIVSSLKQKKLIRWVNVGL